MKFTCTFFLNYPRKKYQFIQFDFQCTYLSLSFNRYGPFIENSKYQKSNQVNHISHLGKIPPRTINPDECPLTKKYFTGFRDNATVQYSLVSIYWVLFTNQCISYNIYIYIIHTHWNIISSCFLGNCAKQLNTWCFFYFYYPYLWFHFFFFTLSTQNIIAGVRI